MKKKHAYLMPNEVCEYADKCKGIRNECNGKDNDRKCEFSCGLRRGLLMSDGYEITYQKS